MPVKAIALNCTLKSDANEAFFTDAMIAVLASKKIAGADKRSRNGGGVSLTVQ